MYPTSGINLSVICLGEALVVGGPKGGDQHLINR